MYLYSAFTNTLLMPFFSPDKGDLLFTAFNADEDGWTIVVLAPVAASTVIYFNDNEATSTSAFNTGESAFQFTFPAATTEPGTVIRFSDIGASRAASIGTFATADGVNNLGLSSTSETLYIYQGTSATQPTTFITAVSSVGTSTELTPAGLTNGVDAIVLTASADYGEYTGMRTGQASWAAYKLMLVNAANWMVDTTNGDYAATVPTTTAFTCGAE